ncbi:MAG: hybrid sensor histidine kinase/response regulator [Acidobacteria bacterium]|nr:hybrid sensor histidine kinase/response regulator [Acidobacteriota bacterium]
MTDSIRVLHLEDSARDAEMIRNRLTADGLSCDIVVVDAKDSFERALRGEPFDLIISDYNLPGYDGIAALKQARVFQPDVPVILISGTVVEEQAVRCLHIGATDYLLKERLDRLVPAVRRALTEADARRARQRVDAALMESEARKAAILDSVLDCIVTMDANGTVLEFNAAAARTFGYSKSAAIGRPLADLIIPARFRQRHDAGLARYLATGDGPLIGKLIETIALRADGSEIPVELTITAIRLGPVAIFVGVLRDITARTQAEALRTQLAAIVDGSDDAIFSMTMDDTILTWNTGAERLYGYTADEMIGQSRTLLVPAAKIDELAPVMATAARGEVGEPFETQRRRKDGSFVDISLVISPLTDHAGRVTSISTIARDITGRKQADATLRGERDRAQRYLDAAEVILLSLDLDGRVVLVNRYACDLLCWPADELLGRDFVDTCVPAAGRDALRKEFDRLRHSDHSRMNNPVVTRTGQERLIEWRSTTLRDDAGRAIGTLSSGTDVTERDHAVAALRKAEERMRFALESAKIGIWDLDYTTGELSWSPTMESQYGLQSGTFGKTMSAYIDLIHPDDRASVIATVAEAQTTGGDFTLANRTVLGDGRVQWLNGQGRIVLAEHGEPVRGIGISQDVTERHLLEAQYQQAQKMEAIGRLAGGVAHDFNNLLTVILGFCELLLVDLEADDQRLSDIGEIQKAGTRAAGLTRQLLAFSRKEIIQPTLLDLNVIVADIRVMLGRLIGEDVTITVTLAPTLGRITADPGQVDQIVLNLAVNARDAMPKGGTLTIETANIDLDEQYAGPHLRVKPGRYVVLKMTDSGTGMTPEVQARLFEPFFTTKEPGKGTGLGLATVHGIATRSGGGVTVDSAVGRGTCFMVYFPRADAAAMPVAIAAPVVRKASGIHTVLVVDDADGLRLLTKRMLERQGYTVLFAKNAQEAVRVFDDHPSIDLLLTDVVMPGASGPELVRQLVERRPALKVIYMSGYTDEAIVHHGVLDPGIAFLHKPFTSETLGRKIQDVLKP